MDPALVILPATLIMLIVGGFIALYTLIGVVRLILWCWRIVGRVTTANKTPGEFIDPR